ncbi:phage tail terminator-like protein [Sphingobium yanoikuyae]|uniref:phage tail terminator-like protein n=1 Tax=Sphingobium yanoikuyae TaxID=13690 RepID=UPI0026E9FF76|nr:phage tail terminator-like protein [Sphingobium yanoikuyae]
MPTIQTTDWLAIKGRVDTLTIALNLNEPGIQILEPGAIVKPAEDGFGPQPYVMLSDVVNDPDRGGRIDPALHVRTGTLMLALHWPISRGISHVQLKEIAGQIAAHFTADTCMSYGPSHLRVTQDASLLPPFVDGAYRVAVVRVFWSSM